VNQESASFGWRLIQNNSFTQNNINSFERTNGGALINAVRENNSTINDTYLSS